MNPTTPNLLANKNDLGCDSVKNSMTKRQEIKTV